MTETRSTCPYCGVGCGVIIETSGAQITGVRGDPDHPANFGRLCTKGSTLHLTATAPVTLHARLREPLRRLTRGAALQGVGWNEALDDAADRFAGIAAVHGPDALGFYISGQLLTEDYYVFNKLAKGLLGTNNIDSNSRLCMSSAVAGYKLTLGADAPPACYDDVDDATTLFIAGSNTAWAHPVLFRRIEDARRANPAQKMIVVDPRRTETAAMADLHLPLLPGTDVALFHTMLHVMLWEGWVDTRYIESHTTGFAALKDRVREFTPREGARITGLQEDAIVQAARWFGQGHGLGPHQRPATLSLYCQGLNQSTSGTAKNAALINLHLATGQIGRPGAGPFSLTGQPNAMGGREVGGMANLLSAHRDLSDPEHRAQVARQWGVDSVPAASGLTAVEMFEAAADGRIKALWIACTNPAQSLPDQATVRRALERAEFIVLQEAFADTATARYADLLLPASTWGEKDGTVTNSERRITRIRAAVPAPGTARDDWVIAADFARRLESRLRPGLPTLFDYASPESVWNEHRSSTRGRDLDITGLTYNLLDTAPAQWPCPEGESVGAKRLYTDGRFATADGRARFADVAFKPVAEPRDARYPFALNTGRLRDQWHGMSRSGTVPRLFGHTPEPALDLHGQDMTRLGLADGDLVRMTSRRGSLVVPVRSTDETPPAQAFLPMHWGDEFLGGAGGGGVNAVTTPARCAQSNQPELKHAAVRIEPAGLAWQLVAATWCTDATEADLRRALQPVMARFGYAACVPFGRDRAGVLLRIASATPIDTADIDTIESLFGLAEVDVLRYDDRRRGQRRSARLVSHGDDAMLRAFMLAGDTSAEPWVRALLQDEQPAQDIGRGLLLPGSRPPGAVPVRGRQVCSCLDVSEPRILQMLSTCDGPAESRLACIQDGLRCGTQCGSCLPELRRMVRASMGEVAMPLG